MGAQIIVATNLSMNSSTPSGDEVGAIAEHLYPGVPTQAEVSQPADTRVDGSSPRNPGAQPEHDLLGVFGFAELAQGYGRRDQSGSISPIPACAACLTPPPETRTV